MENFIEKDILLDLIVQKISFDDCMKILNVSKRTLLKFRKLYGFSIDRKLKNFICECPTCGKKIEHTSTKEKVVHCSRSCANKRNPNKTTKKRISDTLKSKGKITHEKKYCVNCGNDITMKRKTTKFCCRSCNTIHQNKNGQARKAGLASCKKQSKRSKNEILFSELCSQKFCNVLFVEWLDCFSLVFCFMSLWCLIENFYAFFKLMANVIPTRKFFLFK
jgi:predicted RNA-binding Zn-ribbon protein involved in translation (DUF1610 family)